MNEDDFSQVVNERYGSDNVLVVKHALGGQHISRWDNQLSADNLYDQLIDKLQKENIDNVGYETISFVWMQGESDAIEGLQDSYYESLEMLYSQLTDTFERQDINFVIGRISNWDGDGVYYPGWNVIRDIQVDYAKSHERTDWIDTDDIERGFSNNSTIHHTQAGDIVLAQRLADKAIELIKYYR